MMYRDLYSDIIELIDSRIKLAMEQRTYAWFGEVVETDGYYVSIKLLTSDEGFKVCEKVPILQSPYFSPIVKKGDRGIMLNIGVDVSSLLKEGKPTKNVKGRDYGVFLPLLANASYQSQADALTLSSEDLKSRVQMTNESVESSLEGSLTTLVKKEVSISSENTISVEAKKGISIDASKVEIKAKSDPIILGNGVGTLKDVVDSLFSAMDALSQGLTGPSSNPAAYTAQKSVLKQLCDKIVG